MREYRRVEAEKASGKKTGTGSGVVPDKFDDEDERQVVWCERE